MAEQNHLASTEWVDIVNENNEVIAQSSREQMRARSACATGRPISSFMTEWGKILVQRRTETKDFHPGMLDATAGGVVQADEQLLESARREAEEELGNRRGCRLPITASFDYEDKFCRVWGSLFSCVSTGPFALQEEEVSEVCWLTPEEITARCEMSSRRTP
ncbi:NUDIX hydrolase YfcD [Klebsiella pneumoniae subsp. pneumoniae]|nr:NUDIX hydrolase YfcD [Klebsiella pneumoniae subsp. pneumoniae]